MEDFLKLFNHISCKACNYYYATIFVLVAILCMVSVISQYNYNKRLPPGPWGWPYVGYLPWVYRSSPHERYLAMARRYGEVSSARLGRNLVVCVSSPRLVKELFSRDDSVGRPHTPLNDILHYRGIVTSENELWRQQRRFLSKQLRTLGVRLWPGATFQQFVLHEVDQLIDDIRRLPDGRADPGQLFNRFVYNVICQLTSGARAAAGAAEYDDYNRNVSAGMRLYGQVHVGNYLPVYLRLSGKSGILEQIRELATEVKQMHWRSLAARRAARAHGPADQPRDLLDCYLDLFDNRWQLEASEVVPGAETAEDLDEQLLQVMNDLFSAGTDTLRNALAWCVVVAAREAAVRRRARAELLRVLPPAARVTLDHRARLPYLEAVIFETLRRCTVVPLGTTHVNTENWIVNGYYVPKGSHIIPLINHIHMDPELFPEPEKIKPERFLKDGRLHTPENFMPFGVGRRKCLGENLARMELFLFFANIMNTFDIIVPDGDVPPYEGILHTTHEPYPFLALFKDRRTEEETSVRVVVNPK